MSALQRFTFAVMAVALTVSSVDAGKFNLKLNIRDRAPAWKKLPGTDGKKHSLRDLSENQFVVVIFTCNHCPICRSYEQRIKDFTKTFVTSDNKVAVVAINVNRREDDKLPAMITRAKEEKFNFTYLYDESQQIARDFGARKTPECFILNKARKIAYMGGFDNGQKNPSKHYLATALKALLAGKRVKLRETEVVDSCNIKYENN